MDRQEQYTKLAEAVYAAFEARVADGDCNCGKCMANVAVKEVFWQVDTNFGTVEPTYSLDVAPEDGEEVSG